MADELKDADAAELAIVEIEGECNDASLALEGEDWQDALTSIEAIQEKANALHVYIKGKIDG